MIRPDNKCVAPRAAELILQLPPGSRTILEASIVFAAARVTRLHQVTTYFDTPDRLLDRAGLALLVQQSGNMRLQILKSRNRDCGVDASRREWAWRIDKNAPNVDQFWETPELDNVARTIKGRLEPIFVTDIRRTIRLLHVASNTIVAVAIDTGTIDAGKAREAVSELALELKCGRIGQLYRFAEELRGLAPLWISPESKAARGRRLYTGQKGKSQKASIPQFDLHTTAATAFQEIISGTLGHLTANIGPALLGDPEGVHQMRKALRSTCAALKFFEPHLETEAARRFNAGLLCFGRIFGTARDCDVFCLETLPKAMPEMPVASIQRLIVAAEIMRHDARAEVVKALHSRDFTVLTLGLAAWATPGDARRYWVGDGNMNTRLVTLAPSLLKHVASKAWKRGKHASQLSATGLHTLRKSLKKLGYDVEHCRGLYRRHAVKEYCDRCHALEKMLGTANDYMVAQRLALALVTDDRHDLASPAETLAKWCQNRYRRGLKGIKDNLKHFRATPAFWS